MADKMKIKNYNVLNFYFTENYSQLPKKILALMHIQNVFNYTHTAIYWGLIFGWRLNLQ